MKKMIFGSTVMLALAAASPVLGQVRPTPAAPQSFWYVGAGYDYYNSPGTSLNGGGLFGGWRLNRFFGLELGGQYSRKSGLDLTNGYAQALFLLPIGPRFRLFASGGGAYMTASTTTSGITVSVSRSGYRAGGGLEYWLTPRWAVRGEFHRQNAGGVADDYGLGFAYRF